MREGGVQGGEGEYGGVKDCCSSEAEVGRHTEGGGCKEVHV